MSLTIYVADLAAYNNNILFGKHFDLHDCIDYEDLRSDITKMLSEGHEYTCNAINEYFIHVLYHEEYEIHDIESDNLDISLLNKLSLKDLVSIGQLDSVDKDLAELSLALYSDGFITDFEGDVEEAAKNVTAFLATGTVDECETQICEWYIETHLSGGDRDNIPRITRCMDYEKLWHDINIDYRILTTSNGMALL